MVFAEIFGAEIYTYLVIPLLIFFARIIDVSLGTIRIISVAKGFKALAAMLGFFEVLIWLLAIGQIFNNLANVACYLAYAAGFAAGTYMGIILEEKISIGKVIIRIITGRDASKLLKVLKEKGYSVTSMRAEGPEGKVKLLLSVIDRKQIQGMIMEVKAHNPNAFYSIEDVRYPFHEPTLFPRKLSRPFYGFYRKGK